MNNNRAQVDLVDMVLGYIITLWSKCPWMEEWINKELPEIKWAKMSSKKAGCYIHSSKAIHLNPAILDKAGMEQAIEDTLLHELIHVWQYNHPDVNIRRLPPHGKGFRSEMYRINSILKRVAVTTYHDYQMPANEKILRKAKALLARTQSSNEHESALAVAKFAEYMQRYDLQLTHESLVLANQLPELEDQVVAISRQADYWRKLLLGELAYVNACQLFWYPKTGYVEWHMIGREHRLDQIVFLYDYLEEALERIVMAKKATTSQSQGRTFWNSFRIGVAHNIAQRLRKDFQTRMEEGLKDETSENNSLSNGAKISALVVQDWFKEENKAVETFLQQKQYSFRKSQSGSISNATGYDAGQKAGESISLNQQLRNDSSSVKLLSSAKS